jgi:hypothetical protein
MASVLGQSFRDFQLLVDYSPPHIPYRRGKISAMVNRSIGRHVLVLPDDDLLAQDALEVMLAKADEGHPFVYTDYALRRSTGDFYWPAAPWVFESFCHPKCNPVLGLTWMVDRSLWDAVGGFDESLSYFDWAFAYECFKQGISACHIPSIHVLFREHTSHELHEHTPVNPTGAMQQLHAKYPELHPQAPALV